jgi:arsenite methyltransferase
MSDQANTDLREQVRSRYAAAAHAVLEPRPGVTAQCVEISATGSCCGGPAAESCCGAGSSAEAVGGFSEHLYREGETDWLPEEAVLASLGCGNPIAVADLHEGERVLDLGSGGGIDVLLSARRVGPSGFAYGVDMTDDMLTLARANAAQAGAENVEFRKGEIEALPLPDQAVDVVISNCVINLSTDKTAVLAEMFRVLVPGGRIGIAPRNQPARWLARKDTPAWPTSPKCCSSAPTTPDAPRWPPRCSATRRPGACGSPRPDHNPPTSSTPPSSPP